MSNNALWEGTKPNHIHMVALSDDLSALKYLVDILAKKFADDVEHISVHGVKEVIKDVCRLKKATYERLCSVVLSEGLVVIKDKAFCGCYAYISMLPESLTSIGDYAFAECNFTGLSGELLRIFYEPAPYISE